MGLEKLFTLRAVEDTFRIKGYIRQNHPKSAVLTGGGVQVRHFVTGQNTLLSLAGPANKQGPMRRPIPRPRIR